MEVAEYLYKELEKERKFIIWGFYNRFLLGFQRFFPKNLIAKIIYKTQKR
jgi:short-subunit dehydrogenase